MTRIGPFRGQIDSSKCCQQSAGIRLATLIFGFSLLLCLRISFIPGYSRSQKLPGPPKPLATICTHFAPQNWQTKCVRVSRALPSKYSSRSTSPTCSSPPGLRSIHSAHPCCSYSDLTSYSLPFLVAVGSKYGLVRLTLF